MIVKIKPTKPKDCLTSSLELTFAIYTRASFNAWAEKTVLLWRLKHGLWVDEDGMVVS